MYLQCAKDEDPHMSPVHLRLAELMLTHQQRKLTLRQCSIGVLIIA